MGRKKKNDTTVSTEARLMELQELFFQDRDNQAVKDEMFQILKPYARSVALKYIVGKEQFYLPPERVDEVATEAALLTFEQYRKDPNWRVRSSFGNHLYYKDLEALYGQAAEEIQSSLNQKFQGESDKEIIETISASQGVIPWDVHRQVDDPYDPVSELLRSMNAAPEEVSRLLDQAYEILPYSTYLIFMCWFLLKLRKPRTRNISENFKEMFITSQEEDAFDYLLKEMKARIEYHV